MNFNISPFVRFVSKTTYFINETVAARDCRILYIISGFGSFESDGKVFRLSPNTLIFYPYGKPYRIKSEGEEELLFYTINFDFTQDHTDVGTLPPEPIYKYRSENILPSITTELSPFFSEVISFENAVWADNDIKQIYTEALRQNEGCRQIQDSHLRILLINMYRNSVQKNSNNLVCQKIKNLIHSNLRLNIKEIAGILNYHPFYLNELFKKNEESTLHKYLTRQRLIKANELITTTQMSLEEISFICGFSSQSHFSSAFKKAYHIAPRHLRRQT